MTALQTLKFAGIIVMPPLLTCKYEVASLHSSSTCLQNVLYKDNRYETNKRTLLSEETLVLFKMVVVKEAVHRLKIG